jgi:hypothetical protein
MVRPTSPFSGIKLTDQTGLGERGMDQQLFAAAPSPSPRNATPTHLPRKEGSQEPRKVGTQVPTYPGQAGPPGTPAPRETPHFDIAEPATEKNSYMFSEEELWALRDVEAELERTYRADVSKYNIVRLGLHMLLEDYRRDKPGSFLARRLGFKEK